MKKQTRIILIMASLLFTSSLLAQAKQWNWSQYKVSFNLPAEWKVKGNTASRFHAAGKDVTMVLNPWKDPNVKTPKAVAEKAYKNLTNYTNKKIKRQKLLKTKGGLQKYIILVEGFYKRKKALIGIIGLINPDTDVNISGTFIWWADSPSAKANSNLTYRVAQSLAAYK